MCIYYSKSVSMNSLSVEMLAWIVANPQKFRIDTVNEARNLLEIAAQIKAPSQSEMSASESNHIFFVNAELAPLLYSVENTYRG